MQSQVNGAIGRRSNFQMFGPKSIIEILIGGHNVDYYSAEVEIAGEPNKLVS